MLSPLEPDAPRSQLPLHVVCDFFNPHRRTAGVGPHDVALFELIHILPPLQGFDRIRELTTGSPEIETALNRFRACWAAECLKHDARDRDITVQSGDAGDLRAWQFTAVAERRAMQVAMGEPTARVPPEILQTVQQQVEEIGRDLGAVEAR